MGNSSSKSLYETRMELEQNMREQYDKLKPIIDYFCQSIQTPETFGQIMQNSDRFGSADDVLKTIMEKLSDETMREYVLFHRKDYYNIFPTNNEIRVSQGTRILYFIAKSPMCESLLFEWIEYGIPITTEFNFKQEIPAHNQYYDTTIVDLVVSNSQVSLEFSKRVLTQYLEKTKKPINGRIYDIAVEKGKYEFAEYLETIGIRGGIAATTLMLMRRDTSPATSVPPSYTESVQK